MLRIREEGSGNRRQGMEDNHSHPRRQSAEVMGLGIEEEPFPPSPLTITTRGNVLAPQEWVH